MDTKHEKLHQDLPKEIKVIKDHPKDEVINDLLKRLTGISRLDFYVSNWIETFKQVRKDEY